MKGSTAKEFEQLLKRAQKLSTEQWARLKLEVERPKVPAKDLKAFLLTAPTFTKKQLATIERTRKEIDRWRAK